ncbi:MAG: flagellar biosynthetic protein FliO [Zoogloeaceae bacterium]|jgi:flagellar protein FliO/FliZ|nr:flagellar biosynthetic protein FliO [Zoogloeaceae bacterium]
MRIVLFLFLVFPALAPAAETGENVPSAGFFQAFLALAFIVVLLFLLAFLGRKFLGGKGFGQGGLKLLGGVALGPRERIVLVEAGKNLLVIGIVPGQIRTLHTMPRDEAPLENTSDTQSHPLAQSFAQVLQKFAKPHSAHANEKK